MGLLLYRRVSEFWVIQQVGNDRLAIYLVLAPLVQLCLSLPLSTQQIRIRETGSECIWKNWYDLTRLITYCLALSQLPA